MAFETLNSLVELLGRLQRMNKLSRENLILLRQKIFQTIGLAVLTYCFVSMLVAFLTLIASIVRSFLDPWLGEHSHLNLPLIFALFFLIHRFWRNTAPGRFVCGILLLLLVGYVSLSTKKEKFSLARMPLEENERNGRSSLYFAYTDTSCSLWPTDRSSIPLNAYRFHAPFPVYFSVLKSGGPRCYAADRQSFCATRKSTSSAGRLLWPVVFLSLLVAVVALLQWRRKGRRRRPFVDENLRRIFAKDFQVERMRCACLQALNHVLAKTDDSLHIESVQFANAHVRQLFQDKTGEAPKKLFVDGLVEFDRLKFFLSNRSTGESWRIDVGQVLGAFQMKLLISDDAYAVELQFERLQMRSIEIIDQLKNVLLAAPTGEHPLIELLRATICQTIVPCSFHPTDAQAERIVSPVVDVPPAPSPSPSSPPPPSSPSPPVEFEPIVADDHPTPVLPSVENRRKKFLVCLVKAVKLHDVEQPYCLLQLNEPKQTHQSSLAKNGVNPFWDERFLFDCNEQSNELHLQLLDRTKTKKKKAPAPNDRLFADISIPLASFLSETIEQKDIPISPHRPDSIVRLKFGLLPDDTDSFTDSAIERDYPQSRTDDIVALPIHQQMDSNDKDDRVKSSLLCSLNHLRFSRRKKRSKPDQSLVSSTGSTLPSISASFRNFFRKKSKKKPIQSGNFLLDQHDLPSTSTPVVVAKHSFFRRDKSKKKSDAANLSANSLNSYDCSRSDSARNTPIRANVGHPVTMNRL